MGLNCDYHLSQMSQKTHDRLKKIFNSIDPKVDEVNLFFHPDKDEAIVTEYARGKDERKQELFLPQLGDLIKKSGAEFEDKFKIFKKHVTPILKKLKEDGRFKQSPLCVTIQYVDFDPEIVINIKSKKTKKSLFPEPEDYAFDLSMIKRGSGKKKWWKSIDPNSQGLINPDLLPTKEGWPRPYQRLKDIKKQYDGYGLSRGESQKGNKKLDKIELVAPMKIKKLWDYESSDLCEVFSSRFCRMLQEIGVKNVEYYPIKTTCKVSKEFSDTYYQLAVIVGLTNGILFFDEDDRKLRKSAVDVDDDFDHVRAKKDTMDKLKHKIVRCSIYPQAFVVDNDIKEAIEVNGMTGFMFKEIPFFDKNEFK